MAVGYEMRFESATLEQYDEILELMGLSESVAHVDGAIFHWVAKTDDGLIVVDVWESNEHFNRFAEEQIGPYSQQVGIPNPPVTTRYEVHNTLASVRVASRA